MVLITKFFYGEDTPENRLDHLLLFLISSFWVGDGDGAGDSDDDTGDGGDLNIE